MNGLGRGVENDPPARLDEPVTQVDILPAVDLEAFIEPADLKAKFAINRKVARDEKMLRTEIVRTNEMYHKAINFLRNQAPRHNIEIVEVQDVGGSWYVIRSLIQKCLQTK